MWGSNNELKLRREERDRSRVHGVYVGREYATSAEIHVGVEKLLETAFGFCGDVEVFKGRNGGLEFAEAGSEPVTLG